MEQLFLQTVLTVLFNQIVIGAPTAYAGYLFGSRIGFSLGIEDIRILPSFNRVIMELPFHYLMQEIFFYYSHR